VVQLVGSSRKEEMLSNNALQSDKVNLSCLLLSQNPRQLAFAAELDRYVSVKRVTKGCTLFL
jgi:hypothetical protein